LLKKFKQKGKRVCALRTGNAGGGDRLAGVRELGEKGTELGGGGGGKAGLAEEAGGEGGLADIRKSKKQT